MSGAGDKAVLDGDGKLSIAKFPCVTDQWSVVLWEAVALSLARRAGIEVPRSTTRIAADRPVLLLERYDRREGARVPFLSAMSMLSAEDQETRCYLEIVDALRRWGAAPGEDMPSTGESSSTSSPPTRTATFETTGSCFRSPADGPRSGRCGLTMADGMGIGRQEIERMASAFEHEDPGTAIRLNGREPGCPSWRRLETPASLRPLSSGWAERPRLG